MICDRNGERLHNAVPAPKSSLAGSSILLKRVDRPSMIVVSLERRADLQRDAQCAAYARRAVGIDDVLDVGRDEHAAIDLGGVLCL